METGRLANRTALIDYRKEAGDFDGMTIDAEGMLWIAHWGGFQISRWDPIKRKKLMKIDLPVPKVSSCCFGGKDMSTLFITTSGPKDEEEMEKYPLAGALFTCQTDTVGKPMNRFGTE